MYPYQLQPFPYLSDREFRHPGHHHHQGRRDQRDHHYRRHSLDRRGRISPQHDRASATKYSWLDGKDKPGPSDNDIAVVRDGKLLSPQTKDLGLKEEEATKLAVDALGNYSRTQFHALYGHDIHDRYTRAEIPFRIFDELDQELFRGVLKNYVHVRWSDLDHRRFGATNRPGRKDFRRITIALNRRFLDHSRDPTWT